MAQSKHHKHPKTKLLAKTQLYFVYCKNIDSNIIQFPNLKQQLEDEIFFATKKEILSKMFLLGRKG